eukprot:jgi/Tetstr1/455128/TSEL_041980.t1
MTTETKTKTDDAAPKAHAFQAEVARLLHLMVHSVYSNKDIFLRELISNAADACERLRHSALTAPDLIKDDPEFAIRLEVDEAAKRLVVADNGIGMTQEEMIANLGTIARSGTRAFMDKLGEAKDGSALIGQFGVGFYSAFMVADQVEVVSRAAGSDEAWRWSSDGMGEFTVEPVDLADAPARGSRVVLHLKDDALSYAKAGNVERVVRAYSAHVPVPILLVDLEAKAAEDAAPEAATEDEENAQLAKAPAERQLADGTALWTKSKSECRHEYSVLIFLPSMKPFDLFDPDRKGRVKLYVRRVFIADDVDLLPAWLRFARGVIDSADLPLNLSREMLQHNPVLESIRKGVTNRILSELQKLSENDPETFLKIWENFGPVLKEGIYEDFERKDKLLALARFRSSKDKGEGWRTLADYVADMKEKPDADLLCDRMAQGFEGKPFQSITQGAAALDAIPMEGDADTEDKAKDSDAGEKADIGLVTAFLKETLGESVSDVRSSSRLSESPVCLVAPE